MKKYILSLCLCSLFFSCENEKEIALTTITGFPDDIMGCTCYFAENEADFKAQKFIYVDSYERNPAYISVQDSLIPVNAEEGTTGDYEVILDVEKEVQLGGELYHREGTLTVVHKSGTVITKPVYGECGC